MFRGGPAGSMKVVCRGRARRARAGRIVTSTQIAPSAHVDTFTRENLPPRRQWPEFLFSLPELPYTPVLNCAAELLDRNVQAGNGDRRCIATDRQPWTYVDPIASANPS